MELIPNREDKKIGFFVINKKTLIANLFTFLDAIFIKKKHNKIRF
jgi:hypothetical protein